MTLSELDLYFRSFLEFEKYSADSSRNGIQVDNSSPETKEIKKVAFAVDACLETIKKAIQEEAQLLFVHHGMFWGDCNPIRGDYGKRIRELIKNDVALYACHIPLDANMEVGNNFGLAKRLNLQQLETFGMWKGMEIGVGGKLPKPLTLDQISQKMFPQGDKPLHILPFGKKEIQSVGIISGGAGRALSDGIEKGYDLYITGEIYHEQYHLAKEAQIAVIAGGHYQTETVGVSLVMEKISAEKGIETVFIDVPTGL